MGRDTLSTWKLWYEGYADAIQPQHPSELPLHKPDEL